MLLITLILSRILFLANYPFFFDSPEYWRLAQLHNFEQTIRLAHDPVHPVYLWLIQFAQAPWQLSLVAALFGIGGIVVFYLTVKLLFNQRLAQRTLPVLIFFPHLWLLHTNVLHEAVEQFFFLAALLCLINYLKRRQLIWLAGFLLSLYLVFMTFVGLAVWLPICLALVIYLSPKHWLQISATIILAVGLSLASYYLLLPSPKFQVMTQTYLAGSFFGEWSMLNLLRMFRNSWLILWHGYTPISLLVLAWVTYILWKHKNWRQFGLASLVLLPFFLTAKFWYGGLYGRFGALIAYPLALAVTQLPRKYFSAALGLLLFFWIQTMLLYRQTPVAKLQAQLIRNLPRKHLLVISEYQRPQLQYEGIVDAQTLIVNDNNTNNQRVIAKLAQTIKQHRRIYFTKQALTFPYYQYDGQALHIVSRGNTRKAKLSLFLAKNKLELIRRNKNYPLLSIYGIRSQ